MARRDPPAKRRCDSSRSRRSQAMVRVVSVLLAISLILPVTAAAAPRPITPGQRATIKARAVLDRNLITNGGAEISEDGFANAWHPPRMLESESYGHTPGEWDLDVPGTAGGGERYFRKPVPLGVPSAAAFQWLSLAAESAAIDRGHLRYRLTGWFGSMIGDRGSATLSVTFADVAGDSIESVATEPIPSVDLPKPLAGSASLAERSKSGVVPAGTRRLRIE